MIRFLNKKPSLGKGTISIRKPKQTGPVLPNYIALDWLKATGNQRLATGYIAKDNTTFEFKVKSDAVAANYEQLWGSNSMLMERNYNSETSYYFTRRDYDGLSEAHTTVTFPQGQPSVIKIEGVDANNCNIYRDGTLVTTFNRPVRDSYPISLFNAGDSSRYAKITLYYFKIYEGDTLVHDYEPALFEDGTATLLDLVTGDVLENTSGIPFETPVDIPFDINKANPLQYIESTGSEYIDTGLTVAKDLEIEIKYNQSSKANNYSAIFGARSYYGGKAFLFLNTKNSPKTKAFWLGDEESTFATTNSYYQVDTIMSYKDSKITLSSSEGTEVIDITPPSSVNASANTIYIGGSNHSSFEFNCPMRLFYCKIWKAGTLVRDYVPYSFFGSVVLYDKVNQTVQYPGFKAGPAV